MFTVTINPKVDLIPNALKRVSGQMSVVNAIATVCSPTWNHLYAINETETTNI